MTSIPSTMKALIITDDHQVAVKEHPVPVIGDDEILVKVVAVSQNPTDWKHVDYIGQVGSVLGCDFSGIVVQTGKNVTTPKLGEHVAGMVHGGKYTDNGGFAEYLKVPADLVWIVPPGTFTHEQAASINVVLMTGVQAFYGPGRLGLVEPPQRVSDDEWLLVYGGSSGVGQAAIQLAHLSGYKVVSTSSPRNFELVRSYGADAVFDYNDPEVVAQIKGATGDSLTKALDTISTEDAQRITAQALSPSGGKVIVLLAPLPNAIGRDDVELQNTLLYTISGRAFDFTPDWHIPAAPEDRAQAAAFYRDKLPELVRSGAIRPLPLKFWDGGLEKIHEGLQYMREGRVSAQKIVYRIAEP